MPIDRDGNITAAAPEGARYLTRYLVEVRYTATQVKAELTHGVIQRLIDDVLEDLECNQAPAEMHMDIRTSSHDLPLPEDAKNPQLLPEGEGTEGGLSEAACSDPRHDTPCRRDCQACTEEGCR